MNESQNTTMMVGKFLHLLDPLWTISFIKGSPLSCGSSNHPCLKLGIMPSVVGVLESLNCIWRFASPWTAALQAPLSMGFSRQEYWSGLPFPSPGGFPHPGIQPKSPALAGGFLTTKPPGKPIALSMVLSNWSWSTRELKSGLEASGCPCGQWQLKCWLWFWYVLLYSLHVVGEGGVVSNIAFPPSFD